METQHITSIEHPLFEPMWQIYQSSFPHNEKRTEGHQQIAFESEYYRLDVYLEKNHLVGLMGYWEFEDYTYIEHLAINPVHRSGGYGSRILQNLMDATSKSVFLEIDAVIDEITYRRFLFYQRLGFVNNPFRHFEHRYHQEDRGDFLLVVMSYPKMISLDMYRRFDTDVRNIVMKGAF